MSWVFGSKTTRWDRFKVWCDDLIHHFKVLPSYLWPRPLDTAELTEEEKQLLADDEI